MSESPAPTTFPPLVKRAIVLTGPTASGKTSLALQLAERINGEILSLDSIAVYRYMDIGTAKPSLADRQRVPHHLLDLADPNQDFSVACYLIEAHRLVDELIERGKQPIFVGGTPMFLKAVLRGFDAGPPPDWAFREQVQQDVDRYGVEALRRRLFQVDPLSALRIAAGDTRRMIRALEVSKQTGVPLSHRQIQFDRQTDAEMCCVFSLQHHRQVLYERINQRVAQMFTRGLVDEVVRLTERFGDLSRTASQAVGYREVIQWLTERGSMEHVKDLVATHTRQLAKRQETWFRSFSEITTVQVDQFANEPSIIDFMCEHIARVRSLPVIGVHRVAAERV